MIRVIGIDPGVKTGVAVLKDGAFERLVTLTFWDAYEAITSTYKPLDVNVVVVEVATDSNVWHEEGKSSIAKAARTGQWVGAARREGELMADGLRRSFTVITVPPRRGVNKVKAAVFTLMTGYQGRTNEHTRDAGMIAWMEYCRLKQLSRIQPQPTR